MWSPLEDEVNGMVASIEQHGKDVDRVASVEHMNETHETKIGITFPIASNGTKFVSS